MRAMYTQNRNLFWSPQLQKQNNVQLAAMRLIPLRRITPYTFISPRPIRMAEAKTTQSGSDTEKKKEKEEEQKLPMPEPPEKPLPDDCCGSGCVRCVWDVYYDELEAYNKAMAEYENTKDSLSK